MHEIPEICNVWCPICLLETGGFLLFAYKFLLAGFGVKANYPCKFVNHQIFFFSLLLFYFQWGDSGSTHFCSCPPPLPSAVVSCLPSLLSPGTDMMGKLLKMQMLEDEDDLAYETEKKQRTASSSDAQPAWMRTLHSTACNWLQLIPLSVNPLKRTVENIKVGSGTPLSLHCDHHKWAQWWLFHWETKEISIQQMFIKFSFTTPFKKKKICRNTN